MASNVSVVGVFNDPAVARDVKEDLIEIGFPERDVQVHSPESANYREDESVGGFFRSLFGWDDEDQRSGYYSEAVRRGACVVTAHAANDEQVRQIEQLMARHGAVDIDEEAADWQSRGWSGYDAKAGPMSAADLEAERRRRAERGNSTIPVIEERVDVGKREVERGGVRVYSRVIEQPIEKTLNLREEKASVQRRPVDRPATEADLANMKENVLEVRETVEEPFVSKSARVKEEVEIDKKVSERPTTVRETARKTEVRVEDMPAAKGGQSGTTGTPRKR